MAWYMTEDGAYNSEFVELPESHMQKPYPLSIWRIEPGINDELPFHLLMPELDAINVWNLKRENVIRVYDLSEPQTGFKSNGLAVLNSAKCESHCNDDKWDIDIEHPLDEWGKWKYLLVNNILKIDGQLFRIDWSEPSLSASGQIMKAHANHISYDMAGRLIDFGTFKGGNAMAFINWAEGATIQETGGGYYGHYVFSGSSDIDTHIPGGEYINTTLLAAYIGADNSLMHMTGGELYRNNFYFSVNKRMEKASDNAFNLRYSLDMTAIKQTVDYSDFCTDLYCYDNWGNMYAVSYTPTAKDRIHHPITRMRQFNYAEFEGSMERLMADGFAEWLRVSVPKITYEVEIASLRNEPKYAEFLNLQNYRYGDKGTIYCPELDISTEQKIISIDKNELTGDIIRLKLGNLKESFIRPSYMGSTMTSGASADDKQLRALQNQTISKNIEGAEQFVISALETRSISTIEGG